MDDRPILLMRSGRMIEEHMEEARMTPRDVCSKLREAGVLSLDEVEAVVLETTGVVSVLRRREGVEPDLPIFEGVEGADRLAR